VDGYPLTKPGERPESRRALLRGDRVQMLNGIAGRLSHTYENPVHRPGYNGRAAVTVERFADPPHPRHGPHWPEQWTCNVADLTSLELVPVS
jgi:hypothetical protein